VNVLHLCKLTHKFQTIQKGMPREALLKGKVDFLAPRSLYQLRFYVENIVDLCYKTSYHNEEASCTDSFPSISIPWCDIDKHSKLLFHSDSD
jgi:hypothetical protein